ncbi:hypothetical protein HMPREF9098_2228 [Kingella denitrificans ATCC 33394]|uniref:Uncharacterized protein n=1 Tax=Kingella denitrificans ATCC 33394 TaxID=888741 RepID=F0F293_9NEIS|nr:hypothetical protein HMPREF9098_2228 [Kingella denitrificans ATCC 33394]
MAGDVSGGLKPVGGHCVYCSIAISIDDKKQPALIYSPQVGQNPDKYL